MPDSSRSAKVSMSLKYETVLNDRVSDPCDATKGKKINAFISIARWWQWRRQTWKVPAKIKLARKHEAKKMRSTDFREKWVDGPEDIITHISMTIITSRLFVFFDSRWRAKRFSILQKCEKKSFLTQNCKRRSNWNELRLKYNRTSQNEPKPSANGIRCKKYAPNGIMITLKYCHPLRYFQCFWRYDAQFIEEIWKHVFDFVGAVRCHEATVERCKCFSIQNISERSCFRMERKSFFLVHFLRAKENGTSAFQTHRQMFHSPDNQNHFHSVLWQQLKSSLHVPYYPTVIHRCHQICVIRWKHSWNKIEKIPSESHLWSTQSDIVETWKLSMENHSSCQTFWIKTNHENQFRTLSTIWMFPSANGWLPRCAQMENMFRSTICVRKEHFREMTMEKWQRRVTKSSPLGCRTASWSTHSRCRTISTVFPTLFRQHVRTFDCHVRAQRWQSIVAVHWTVDADFQSNIDRSRKLCRR